MLNLLRSKIRTGNWYGIALLTVSVLVWSGNARMVWAADGDLDPTFGVGGKVVTDFNGGNDFLNHIALQPDGKIVASGYTYTGSTSSKFALARYNPDGSLDSTFGNAGRVVTVIANVRETGDAVLILPDGKILISGSIDLPSTADTSFALLRYNSDGSLDTTFGNNGIVKTNVGPDDDQAYALALQPDGKIIAAGRKGIFFYPTEQRKGNVAVARYNANGSLDTTFGSGGIVTNDFGQGLESYALASIVQPDGRIVIGGESSYEFLAARYMANGSLDTTFGFGGRGYSLANFSSNWDFGEDAALQADGKIILAGSAEVNSPYDNPALARYNPDGTFDQSFGSNGKVLLSLIGDLTSVVVQGDGKIVALGINDADSAFLLLRFNSNGTLDSTFGSGGQVLTSFGNNIAEGSDLLLQPDGKLLAGGISSAMYYNASDFALARYNSGSESRPTITGTIAYGNAIGAPNPRYVSSVLISGVGSTNVSAMTDPAGNYSLTGFGVGSYTVTPTKTGGQNGISSFDAAMIAQHVAGVNTLAGNQLIVADVSGDGTISSFDAAEVARYSVSIAGSGSTGNWVFNPANRAYATVSNNISGEDYTALLMGEVSGNWTNSGPRPANNRGTDRGVTVNAQHLVTPRDNRVIVPVTVQGVAAKGIISYQFDLKYDASVIQPDAQPVDLANTVSSGLSFVVNAEEPGLLRVAVYGPLPINGDGVLLNLRFKAIGTSGSASTLIWEHLMFNDQLVKAANGTVELLMADQIN